MLKYLRSFLDELLDVVLSKVAVAGVIDLAYEGDGLCLADSHQPDLVRPATATLRCPVDTVEHRS